MSKKVLVVGIDGLTFDLIMPWISEGKLPTFKKMIDLGSSGLLKSTYPPSTAAAWASFATGKNPGKHGVYDLTMLDKKRLIEIPATSNLVHGETLWEILSRVGKKVIVVGIPVTYPPKKVNGILISDFLTPPKARDFTYPKEILEEVEKKFGPYRLHYKEVYCKNRVKYVLDEAFSILEYNKNIATYFIKNKEWDFFAFHIFGTDRIQHELWHLIDEKNPLYSKEESLRFRERFIQFFIEVDKSLSEIFKLLDKDTSIFIISDHGFGPITHYLAFNVWLIQEGFLSIKNNLISKIRYTLFKMGWTPEFLYKLITKLGLSHLRQSRGVGTRHNIFRMLEKFFLSLKDVDWKKTLAYSKGNYAQIYLNLKGREIEGIVEPGEEFYRIRENLINKLLNIKAPLNNSPLFNKIYTCEELYWGKHLEFAPDLFFLPSDMRFKALGTMDFISNKFIQKSYGQSGDHRVYGVFLALGDNIKKSYNLNGAQIIDITPTILYLLGVPIPSDMDGKVLLDIFEDNFIKENPVKLTDEIYEREDYNKEITEEEEEEIKKRLKDIGYYG